MKHIFLLCANLTLAGSQVALFGQEDFNPDLYSPMPLQTYAPPKDTAYRENQLVFFNMLEKTFGTVPIGKDTDPPRDLFSSSGNNGASGESILRGNEPVYDFTDWQPADQLTDFPDYPYSTIVKLFLTFYNPVNQQNSFATCSGVMIHPEFLITGGHCVKSFLDSSYAVECIVVPAYNLGSRPFGLTTTTDWYAPSQWTVNKNLDYDMAVMHLSDPIGDATGWMGLGYHSDDNFFTSPSNVFYSFGYPGYDALGNPVFEEGERMYYRNGYMDYWLTPNRMCHNNIAYSGTSGSGLFHQDSSNNRKVYGILSHGSIFPPHFTCHSRLDSLTYLYFSSILPVMTGLEKQRPDQHILIYPNPSDGLFTLDFIDIPHREIELRVFDVFGQQIIRESMSPTNSVARINLTAYPPGAYFIQAAIDGKSVSGRILKTE